MSNITTSDNYDDFMRKRGLPDKPHAFMPQEYARDFCAYQPTSDSPRCNLSRMNTVAHVTTTPLTVEECLVELREMFPDRRMVRIKSIISYYQHETVETWFIEGLRKQFIRPTLNEAMTQVRQWCKEQNK